MAGSLAVRAAFSAIAHGARLPDVARVRQFNQQSRTIEQIKRRGVDVVVDAGANRGFYAKHLRMSGYDGHILAFEPEPDTFRRLEKAAAGDDRWRCFNLALGDAPGEIDFNVLRNGEETVLSSPLTPLSQGEDFAHQATIRVPVETLSRVLPDLLPHGAARIFLKMDTQGYDLKVFEGARDIAGIRLLQSEISVIPLYEGMPHYTESLLRYEQAGFNLLDLFVVRRVETGAVLEYDALLASD